MYNILILSCGTRNKIIQYFKKALIDENGKCNGRVIATDMSEIAPALYEADEYYIVPRMTSEGYIEVILDICRKENIKAVLSLIDPELSLIAKYGDQFNEIGVKVIGSSYELCEMSLNKMRMYEWLEKNDYRTAKSYIDKERFYQDVEMGIIKYPVFVKPICGSASIAISKVNDRETLEFLFSKNSNLIIQEYLQGQEIGADVYIDMVSCEVVSIFTKKKLIMRAGETDKAVSFIDDKLNDMIVNFVHKAGYRGQIDIDIFDIDGEYYISEVNPRFGGGYPHAYECGCDHMKMILNNLKGFANENIVGKYMEAVYMMKYNEVLIK